LFRASAPGSLMLLGEYAVLHGYPAVVCAIDKRIHVTLTPRDDMCVILDSALGHHETTLSQLEVVTPFQFVLETVYTFKKKLRQGFHLHIESEFSDTVGFASSAAVTVATTAVLSEWLALSLSKNEMIQKARDIVYAVQGSGSGADVAACVSGGLVFYRKEPFIAETRAIQHPMTVVYSGHKTPTPIAIQQVEKRFLSYPVLFSNLMKAIGACVEQGFEALKQHDWQVLGEMMTVQQGLMDALGVNTAAMNGIIHLLRQEPALSGVKISGSGFGDCVVALGECSAQLPNGAKQIRINMASEGVRIEKI